MQLQIYISQITLKNLSLGLVATASSTAVTANAISASVAVPAVLQLLLPTPHW